MGGAVGSIKHIWDFGDLTLAELLEIFEGILEGSIDAIEKTDGLPIVWRWTGDEVLWARSSSDVRDGGYTAEEFKMLYSSFPGIKILEAGIDFFAEHVEPRISGLAGFQRWVDSELFSPRSVQFVPSEKYAFIIHRTFAGAADSEGYDPFEDIRAATGRIKAQGNNEEGKSVEWLFMASSDSPAIPRDGEQAREAVREIEADLKRALEGKGLSLNQSIQDWIAKEAQKNLERTFPEVSGETIQLAITLVANPDDPQFRQNANILKAALKQNAPELLKQFPTTKKVAREMKGEAIAPIKRALKVAGAKFISQLSPTLITAENYDVIRDEIRSGIEVSAEILETAEDEEMIRKAEKAAKQLAIVSGNEHLLSPYEGFVVKRGDDLMKVTGIFHDAGTIKKLGYKPSIAEIDWQNADTIVSIFPLAAKPAHAGHWDMIEGISKIQPVNPATGKSVNHVVKVIASEAGRERPGEISISPRQALTYWSLYLKKHLPENVTMLSTKDIFGQIQKETIKARSNPNVLAVWIWSGDKDAGRFDDISSKIEGVSQPPQAKAEAALGRPTTNVSGTRMRQAIADDDMEFFIQHLPAPLSREEREEIWALFTE